MYHPIWLGEIEVHAEQEGEEAAFDFYIFSPFRDYQSVINDKHLKIIYVDMTSGAKLASAHHGCSSGR
jgi:hypothetical protein